MKRAAIDIGSNSVLLLIANVSKQKVSPLLEKSSITQLGRGLLSNSKLDNEAIMDTLQCLKEFSQDCLAQEIDYNQIVVTATEAVRRASNGQEFIQLIKTQTGLDVSLLSEEGEAYYSFHGSVMGEEEVVLIDMGGSSTEIVTQEEGQLSYQSLPLGAVVVTEALSLDQYDVIRDEVLEKLSSFSHPQKRIVGVGGTFTSLAAMLRGSDVFSEKIDCKVTTEDMINLNKIIEQHSTDSLGQKFTFLGKRARVMRGGLKWGIDLLQHLKCQSFEVSFRGLRYGTIKEGSVNERYKC